MTNEIKIRILKRLFKGYEFLFFFVSPIADDMIGGVADGDKELKILPDMLDHIMKRQPAIRELFLERAKKYLSEYEIDKKNFIEELNKN